jgi:hypothetical protein
MAVDATYDMNVSSKSENDIANLIIQASKNFNNTYLNDFNKTMRYSKLAAAIDGADPSILSTNLVVRMMKKISPVSGTVELFTLDYQNAIKEGTFISGTFMYRNITSYFKDDGAGNVSIVTSTDDLTSTSGIREIIVKKNIGTINYGTGIVSINIPSLDAYIGDSIKVYAESFTNDFSVKNNTVILIVDDDINVSVAATRA